MARFSYPLDILPLPLEMVLETICIIPTHHKAVKLAPMNGIRGEGRVSIYNTLCWTFTRLSSLPVRTCPQLEVYLREGEP